MNRNASRLAIRFFSSGTSSRPIEDVSFLRVLLSPKQVTQAKSPALIECSPGVSNREKVVEIRGSAKHIAGIVESLCHETTLQSAVHFLLSDHETKLVMQRMDTIPNFACVNIGQKNLPLTNDRMVQVYGSPSQIRDVVESVLVVVQERKHLLEGAYHDKYEPYPSLPLFQKLEIPKTLVSGALGVNYSKLDGIQKATGTSIHLVSEVNSEHKVCLLVYGQSKGPVDLAIARLFDVVKSEITRKMNEIVGRKYVAETVAPVSLVDYIIGERGKTVIQLSKKTNTAIDIHRGTGVCRVIGFDANTVSSATTSLEVTISRLKSEVLPYLSAIKPGYKYQFSNMVDIPTSSVKTIIGDRAKQIRKLETTSNVRVRFQDLVDQKRMSACVVYGDDLEHIERAMNAIATILSR